jgi:hypothetical protein
MAALLSVHGDLINREVDPQWLARCVRSVCVAAVTDPRPPEVVVDDLAATLRRLVLAPAPAPAA